MKILDSKGRLFGKISILDLGAACVILLVIVGIFFPSSGGSIAQVNETKPIEVDMLVRGLSLNNPVALKQEFEKEEQADIIIRNQPAGAVKVKSIKELPRTVSVPQPDGSVKALPDPRPEVTFIQDFILTISEKGQITEDGLVLRNQKIKIGTPIEIDSTNYNFKGSVMDIRIGVSG
jgi:Domain of unknown function (DUF4330)